ncbi:hypothetical protein C2857_006038 [Epichloe festucae Fl1]|uniref:chitinase n=1 Tax=Epichloe festucae (strain Fl1) TaxID=877507 RepID=A0A7S9KLB6_EPIFF|nr:hypothetical protein C2857_006038 [Epichloe festucae Fl1]
MDPGTASLYRRVSALKARQSYLQFWIAIGEWAMNDPGPWRTVFSDLAKSESAQNTFFDSLVSFLQANDLDGVDLDWEYPVADDRGGIPADYNNYGTLCKRLKERLNRSGRKYGLTLTLPASYGYLRGFNIMELEKHIDWFNIMTYDIRATVTFDMEAAADIVTWGGAQWVSWNDAKTLKLKLDYANLRCLGG